LEKEINLLKRMLITNEEIGDDYEINIPENISLSSYPNNNQPNYLNPNSYQHLSARKEPRMQHMIMSSAKRIPESASKTNTRNYDNQNHFFEPESMSFNNQVSNSAYRRSLSEYKTHLNNSSFKNQNINTSSKTLMMMNSYSGNNNNNMMSSSIKNISNPIQQNNFSQFNAENDIDMILNMNKQDDFGNLKRNSIDNMQGNSFNFNTNSEAMQLIQNLKNENEDLKRNYFEIRNKFMETVQMKDNQIKSLNTNMTITMDNCEKIIKEAEDNFVDLKTNNEKLMRDNEFKDSELNKIIGTTKNYEVTISNLKEENEKLFSELSSYKQVSGLKEMEVELINLRKTASKLFTQNEENEKKEKLLLKENEKLKSENNNIKVSAENFKSENFSYKAQVDCLKKTNDSLINDNGKLKNDIESYKNELHSNKEKINKMKSELNQIKTEKEKLMNDYKINEVNKKGIITKGNNNEKISNKNTTNNNNNAITELEKMKVKYSELENEIKSKNSYISLLEKEKEEYKSNYIDKESLAEYEKILDLTENKIKDYEVKLEVAKEKISFYEKMFKIAENQEEQSTMKKIISETPSRNNNDKNDNQKNKYISNTGKNNSKNISAVNTNKNLVNSELEKSINIPFSAKSAKNKALKESFNKGVSQFNFNEMENRKNSLMTPTNEKLKDKNILKSNSNLINGFSPNKSVNCSNSKELLGKKRHLSKVYQNIVDNNLKSGKGNYFFNFLIYLFF